MDQNPKPPFEYPVRIYWEDTDAGGIVYYANYLKFFERARTEWLRHLGIEQQALRQQTGGAFVAASADIRYLKAVRLDDMLLVSARLLKVGLASVDLEQQAHHLALPSGKRTLACQAGIQLAWVWADSMKPARLPADLLKKLKP